MKAFVYDLRAPTVSSEDDSDIEDLLECLLGLIIMVSFFAWTPRIAWIMIERCKVYQVEHFNYPVEPLSPHLSI